MCEQLGHVHSVVWLHDTTCEAAVTDEPGTGNYVPSGVPYVPVVIPLWSKGAMFHPAHNCRSLFTLIVSKVTGECKPIMDMPWQMFSLYAESLVRSLYLIDYFTTGLTQHIYVYGIKASFTT